MFGWLKKWTNIHKDEMAQVGQDKLQIEEMSYCDILFISSVEKRKFMGGRTVRLP
jgi:hypothetical protein